MTHDVIIVGGGASGLMAAIGAAQKGRNVLICEYKSRPGIKVLATGGGRCNLSNTLPPDEFMNAFGRFGRFMEPALRVMGSRSLRSFLGEIGVETHCPDGLRIWPVTHSSKTVQQGLVKEAERLGVTMMTDTRVTRVSSNVDGVFTVVSERETFDAQKVIVATGGLSHPALGATGDGYLIARGAGHTIAPTVPAGVPLLTRERWTERLTADTVGKAQLKVNIKKHSNIVGVGDLIFTTTGIAGPAALDLSGQIAQLLTRYDEVPLALNLAQGRTRQDWQDMFKNWRQTGLSREPICELLQKVVSLSLSQVLCDLAQLDPAVPLGELLGGELDRLLSNLSATPLTVVGTGGYDLAIVTKGGVRLKNIDPRTLQSKLQKGLYFCGEVLDLDGPCGGYNLQWAFASGYLAGQSAASEC